jgi:hypothetical protein
LPGAQHRLRGGRPSNKQVAAAISRTYTETGPAPWLPARRQDGEVREGAQVAELTDLVDLSDWPDGIRLIVRREPLHPGAQQTLLPSTQFRYWGHYTDQTGPLCQPQLRRIEQSIR